MAKQNDTSVVFEQRCKVCNSVFRDRIEELALANMSPEKIHNYLQTLRDPAEIEIVKREDIKPSAIRRHLQRHFKHDERVQVKLAESHSKLEKSRQMLNEGAQITIDKINTLCHMIDAAMIKMEAVDDDVTVKGKDKYILTVNLMNSARATIESLAKLTGELKQEGTIDLNFFSSEITTFANVVLETIRSVDNSLNLNGELEIKFAEEFAENWKSYRDRQIAMINGQIPIKPLPQVNTFNDNSKNN